MEYIFGSKPNLNLIHPWGCAAYAHIQKRKSKLAAKAIPCVFLGFSEERRGYKLLTLDQHSIINSRSVSFNDNSYPDCHPLQIQVNNRFTSTDGISFNADSKNRGENNADSKNRGENNVDSNNRSNDIDARVHTTDCDNRSARNDRENTADLNNNRRLSFNADSKNRGENIADSDNRRANDVDYNNQEDMKPPLRRSKRIATQIESNSAEMIPTPSTYREAMDGPNRSEWFNAANNEYLSLIANDTWSLCVLPKGRQNIKSKWVFKIKYLPNGTIDRFKARLVAKGYLQIEGVDYHEVSSPVLRLSTLRILLSIITKFDLEAIQLDVTTAFLNGHLNEELYMEQPEGFVIKGEENKSLRLHKCIYGLKQASNVWYKLLHSVISKELGFNQCYKDSCVYVKEENSSISIIAIYVDDIILCGNKSSLIDLYKSQLMSRFKMKDNGPINWILGLKIQRNRDTGRLSIDQSKYIKDLLNKFNMTDCKPVYTPAVPGHTLLKDKTLSDFEMEQQEIPFRQIIGGLQYLVSGSRPDIASAERHLSSFVSCYNDSHYQAAKRILRYLKHTMNYGLTYSKSEIGDPYAYVDADYANGEDRKSVTGYVTMHLGAAITWQSKKQNCVSRSTAEAEYVAANVVAAEVMWLRQFLKSYI